MKLISRLFRRLTPDAAPSAVASESPAVSNPPDTEQRPIELPTRIVEAIDVSMVTEPAEISRLVLEGSSSQIRQQAAERVQELDQIRELLNRVRGRDNTVYRILKQKRDALNATLRRAAEVAEEASTVCMLLERHAQRPHDAQYTQLFEQLTTRWSAVAAQPDAGIAARVSSAADSCRLVVAGHQQQLATLAAQRAAQLAADAEREQARRAEQEAAATQNAMEEQRHQDLVAARVAEAAARAELLAAEEQHFRQLGGLIRKANTALGDGNTRMAAGLRRAIDEKITTAAAMPVYLQRGLQQLDDKLNALKEWKDYAVAPKRIELIEAMEALVGLDEDPQVLAGQIQSLQQDWRTISMGIAGDTSAEWERFHQAADQAYLPCREYFEAQAKRRADNLEQRKAVLARLNAFETAQHVESPDWRLIVTVLREAPQEWRRHFPVERAANRAVEAEFDAVIARLQVRLDTWYTRNAADKQSLVEQAGRLLALEDGGAAIDAVKKLQGHWRDAGPVVPREQDQRLWEDFRAQCDAVFQKRQQAYADYAAGLEANKARAIALCVELEQCAELGDATLLERAVKLPEWRSEFEALGELPRADARALYTRFERANSHCLAQLARQRERETAQAVMNLLEAGRRVQACERAVAGSLAAEERAVLKRGAEAFIASAKAWPKGGLLAVGKRLAAADALTALDAAANEKALRSLCIRGEILNESPTPPEDESTRRDYQMQKLVRGMGKGLAADDWSVLLLEWVSTGAVAAAIYLPLEARFVRCMPKQVAPSAPGA